MSGNLDRTTTRFVEAGFEIRRTRQAEPGGGAWMRQAFIRAHPYPADEIPTISLSSSVTTLQSATAPAQRYMMARYNEPSDGLVLTRDAEIPGSQVVRLQNLDHNGSVWTGVLERAMGYKPEDVTQALVTLALRTPRPHG